MNLKRSIINSSIETAKKALKHFNIYLPYYSEWSTDSWKNAGNEYDEIRTCMLGWDVTDFGSKDFYNIGRVLFTLRNGRAGNPKFPKEYAEKILIDPEIQRAPAHFHLSKREDLICIAGGNILVQVSRADEEGQPSKERFSLQVDGRTVQLEPNATVRLQPGMSICIPPRTIHQFWGEEGTGYKIDGVGYTISREISSICDDWNDNVFLEANCLRFPEIEEDEVQKYYLCSEYPSVK